MIALREPAARWRWMALALRRSRDARARADGRPLRDHARRAACSTRRSRRDPRARACAARASSCSCSRAIVAGRRRGRPLRAATTLGPYQTVGGLRPVARRRRSPRSAQQWLALAVMSRRRAARRRCSRSPCSRPRGVTATSGRCSASHRDGRPAAARERATSSPASRSDVIWSIERYVEYAVPLLLVAAVRRRFSAALLRAPALGVVVGPRGADAARLARRSPGDRAARASTRRRSSSTGCWASGLGAALAARALLVAGGAAFLVARLPPARAVPPSARCCSPFVVQGQWIWRWQIDFTKGIRAQYPARASRGSTTTRGRP